MPPPHALPSPRVRSHAHPRATMRTAATSSIFDCLAPVFPTGRPCMPARRACSGRRLEEPEVCFSDRNFSDQGGREETGPRQVWSHRAPEFILPAKAKCPTPRGPYTMSSHLGLDPARRCRPRGAPVGALSSRCHAAALGADRAGQLRARRYYIGV